MSEHRAQRDRVTVLPFRRSPREEPWPTRSVLRQLTARARYTAQDLRTGYLLGADALLLLGGEQFEDLEVLFAGTAPEERDRLIERLAPAWAKLTALRERNRQAAKALKRRRQRLEAQQREQLRPKGTK